jgi:hypothetical protein
MHKVKHFTLGVAGAAVLATALAFAPAAFAAPSGYFDFTHSYTEDTRIACGSGASSFDIIDRAFDVPTAPTAGREGRSRTGGIRNSPPVRRAGRGRAC